MKYTIIVPLYNCEAYVERCLKSLLSQGFEDYEIVVVNDGSTDGSLEVAENCTKNAARVRIVSQENRGLSGARNTGIREAKGDYLIFIDSDDYVEPTLLSGVDRAIDGRDLLMYGYYNDVYKSDELVLSEPKVFQGADLKACAAGMEPLTLSGLIGFAWNKVYSRALVVENGLCFREGTSLIEDIVFNNAVFSCTDNIGILCVPLVHYVQRTDRESLSRKKYSNLTELLTESFLCRRNFFKRYDAQGYKQSMMEIFGLMLVYILNFCNGSSKDITRCCRTFYENCKNELQLKNAKDFVMCFLLKTKLICFAVLLYQAKQKARRL